MIKNLLRLFIFILIILIDSILYYFFKICFYKYFILIIEYRLLFLYLILFINILIFKEYDFEFLINEYGSLYEYKLKISNLYWPLDFMIDIFFYVKKNKVKGIITLLISFIIFLLLFKYILKYLFICFIFLLFFFIQWFFFSTLFFSFLNIEHEYKININKFNIYSLNWIQIFIFYLYYLPKILAFLINYFLFSNKYKKEKIKNTIKNFIYYRILGIPLIWLRIIHFIFRIVSEVILNTNWNEKYKLSWFFIFLYYINKLTPMNINANINHLSNILRGRKIIVKNYIIMTNSIEYAIIKEYMYKKYMSIHGQKIVALFAGKNHPFIAARQDIYQKGSSYGATLTHAKYIPSKPFNTDKTLKIESKLINAKQNQSAIFGFINNEHLSHKTVSGYDKQFLNSQSKYIYEVPILFHQMMNAYIAVKLNYPFLYQSGPAKKMEILQDLLSKNEISLSTAKLIKEDNPQEFLEIMVNLQKQFPNMTEEDYLEIIKKTGDDFIAMSSEEKAHILTEALLEHGDISFDSKESMLDVFLKGGGEIY